MRKEKSPCYSGPLLQSCINICLQVRLYSHMSFHLWEYTSRVRVLYWVQCYFLWKTEESALNKQKCIYNDRWAVLIVILSHISCLKCPKSNKRLLFTEPCHWHSTPRWHDRRLHKFSCLPVITNGNNVFCSSGTSIQTLRLRAVDCHQGLLESMACPPSRTLPWQLKLLASWGCCFSARGAVLSWQGSAPIYYHHLH